MSTSHYAPDSLLYYHALLNGKKNVSSQEARRYDQIFKGYLGERRLEEILLQLDQSRVFPLFNLLYEINGSEFQIDVVLLTSNTIYLLEVKNFTGDYIIENNKIYSLHSRTQIYNPLHQLERTEYLFKKLLDNFNIKMKISSHVVFINPRFVLYGAQVQSPFLFASQVERFLKRIVDATRPLTQKIYVLAEKLSKASNQSSIYNRFPKINKSEIKKGTYCIHCFQSLERKGITSFHCKNCNKQFKNEEIILQIVYQRYVLFPEDQVTVGKVAGWCNHKISKPTIRRILTDHFNIQENGRYTVYTFKQKNQHREFLSKYINEKVKEESEQIKISLTLA